MKTTVTYKEITFVNAQAMAKAYPETFEAPTEQDLKAIKAGDYIKVCVKSERFWVEVTVVNGEIITGRVDNDLIHQKIKHNDIIEIPKKCVFAIGDF